MKKIPFLIFTAIVIIAVSVCIILNYKTEAMIGLIVGFVCGVGMAIWCTDTKAQQSEYICKDDFKETSVGEVIGIGIGIGTILALFGGFVFGSAMGALFLFIGSVLGAIVGLMYQHPKMN